MQVRAFGSRSGKTTLKQTTSNGGAKFKNPLAPSSAPYMTRLFSRTAPRTDIKSRAEQYSTRRCGVKIRWGQTRATDLHHKMQFLQVSAKAKPGRSHKNGAHSLLMDVSWETEQLSCSLAIWRQESCRAVPHYPLDQPIYYIYCVIGEKNYLESDVPHNKSGE